MDQDLGVQKDAKTNSTLSTTTTTNICNKAATDECAARQLHARVLPPYIPSNPKFQLTEPVQEFCCQECGDRFLFQASLTTHMGRKSVHISYYCESCEQLLSFYNRCTFLAHIHSHSKDSTSVLSEISKAQISPISRELLDLSPPSFSDNQNADETISSPPKDVPDPEPVVSMCDSSVKEQEEPQSKEIKCFECGLVFKNSTGKLDHITKPNDSSPVFAKCLKCNLTCPSKCSLQAHERMHTKSIPFVCPECGELFLEALSMFRYHVNQVCLHNSRMLGYKCLICSSAHSSVDLVTKHIMGSHAEAYYKCDACPMAFKAVVTFINHKAIAHPIGSAECKTIYKCPLCDTVFHCSKQLTTHVEAHFKEQPCEMSFIFKCPECVHTFDSKTLLTAHLAKMHQHTCSTCSLTFHSKESLRLHVKGSHLSPNKAEDAKKCNLCDRTFKTTGGFNSHRQFSCHGSLVRLMCAACGLMMTSKTELAIHGRWHIKKDAILCLLCNNQPFESRERLWAHLKVHVQGMKYPGKCFQCDTSFHGTIDAFNHLKGEHQDIPGSNVCCESTSCHAKVKDRNSEKADHHICWICRRECFKDQDALHRHLKNTHSITPPERPPIKLRIPLQVVKSALEKAEHMKKSKDNLFSRRLSLGSYCSLPKKAKLNEENEYVCAKCNFHSQNSEEFQCHIVSHKTDKHSYQCKECGACFVVKSALRKHLFIAHKIQDVEAYLAEHVTTDAENTSDNDCKSSGTDTAKGATSNALECSICFASFETETALRTHLRSHGMAFIQSKKFGINSSPAVNS